MMPFTQNALFATLGIAFLLAGELLKPRGEALHDLLFNLGIVTISVALLDWLWRFAGGNPIERQMDDLSQQVERLSRSVDVIEHARKVGLVSMFDCAGNFGGKLQWFELLSTATGSMDLMGRTLYEWIRAPELDEILLNKIKGDGVQFRWLLMSADNQHLTQLEEDGERIGEVIARKIEPVCKRLLDIRDRLPQEKKHLLQIRLFNRVPLYCSMLRIDDRYLITPYLQSAASKNSPLLSLHGKGTPWARAYDREFDLIWNSGVEPAVPGQSPS